MSIAFHIPAWVLWVIGVPLAVVVLALAWLGWQVLREWSSGSYV